MMTLLPETTEALSADAMDQLFREAHTAYDFTNEPVTDAELAELYDLVRFAPTMMNTQPLRILFVRTDEGKARLLPHVAEGNRAKAQAAPVVAILAADHDFHEHLPRLLPHAPGARDLFADASHRSTVAEANAHLQAGYLILAIRALGLDAGPMGGFDKRGVDDEFLAGTSLRSFLLVNIGHVSESGTFPRSPRLQHDEAVTLL
jgi:3-hydroxypropanoate dehydrogenase